MSLLFLCSELSFKMEIAMSQNVKSLGTANCPPSSHPAEGPVGDLLPKDANPGLRQPPTQRHPGRRKAEGG